MEYPDQTRHTEPAGEIGISGPGAVAAAPPPGPPQPFFGAYLSVVLYLVGYFVVGIFISIVLAMGLGILVGMGVITLPPIEQQLSTVSPMDIEALMKVMEPYLLPLVLITGLYSVLYTWAFARIVDRRRLRDLGVGFRRGWLGDFSKGAAIAVLILGVVFAFSLMTGSIKVEGFARPAPDGTPVLAYLIGAIIAFLIVGFYEELMFRGYVLQRLNDRTGRLAAIIISSVVFAVFHGANPGADVTGVFNTALIGAVLCALYFRSGSLWMPIGFHAAWNFSLGYLYSLPVSGVPIYGILNVVEVEQGSRLTGGSYGPEAGLLSTIVIAALGVWLIWKRTGRGPVKG